MSETGAAAYRIGDAIVTRIFETRAVMPADRLMPVVAAGRVAFVPPEGGEMRANFTVVPTPGHGRDHMWILLRAGGEEALFAGDVLRHPITAARPDRCSMFCENAVDGGRSRRRMPALAAERGRPWFGSHCADMSVGTARRDGDRFAWSFR